MGKWSCSTIIAFFKSNIPKGTTKSKLLIKMEPAIIEIDLWGYKANNDDDGQEA